MLYNFVPSSSHTLYIKWNCQIQAFLRLQRTAHVVCWIEKEKQNLKFPKYVQYQSICLVFQFNPQNTNIQHKKWWRLSVENHLDQVFIQNIWVHLWTKITKNDLFKFLFVTYLHSPNTRLQPPAIFEAKLGWNTNEREFPLSDCSPHFGRQNDLIWNKLGEEKLEWCLDDSTHHLLVDFI